MLQLKLVHGFLLLCRSFSCRVCLDGSPPAYHLHRGNGTGINNWLVHIEGGGWCNNVTSYLERKYTHLGSSWKMDK
ncbi:hypothetical protein SOVF_107970 isoform A [Spinacia oleracea]|nr:hypothetical protein SOVF_107970 isoform A [Spinacia oleracea]